jgi:hypothetical protein
MHFGMKNILKSNRNPTLKQALTLLYTGIKTIQEVWEV